MIVFLVALLGAEPLSHYVQGHVQREQGDGCVCTRRRICSSVTRVIELLRYRRRRLLPRCRLRRRRVSGGLHEHQRGGGEEGDGGEGEGSARALGERVEARSLRVELQLQAKLRHGRGERRLRRLHHRRREVGGDHVSWGGR